MKKKGIAVVYDTENPSAEKTALWLEREGWEVIRLVYGMEESCAEISRLDLLVVGVNLSLSEEEQNRMGGCISEGLDYDRIAGEVNRKLYAAHMLLENCIPALRAGENKRIAFLTKTDASITNSTAREGFAEKMVLAGLHMKAAKLFHRLRPEGFTFRVFAEGAEREGADAVFCAGEYFCSDFCIDGPGRTDDNRLVMRDCFYREIGW